MLGVGVLVPRGSYRYCDKGVDVQDVIFYIVQSSSTDSEAFLKDLGVV